MRTARFGMVVVTVILGTFLHPALRAQQHKQLFVSVVDSMGIPVSGIVADDVKVLEDQVAGKTIKVEPITWPMKLTILVDNGLRSTDYLQNLRTGLQGFLKDIPDGVEMSLLGFAPQPRFIVKPTKDLGAMEKGLSLITPDSGGSKFFDGLAEAADRISKDKADHFPVIFIFTSDIGATGNAPLDYQIEKLEKQLVEKAVTVHVLVLATGTQGVGAAAGSIQTTLGIAITKFTGGRYDNIATSSRLQTILPEFAKQIAQSNLKQTRQYRVTYDSPPNASKTPDTTVSVSSHGPVIVRPTVDGHMP